MYAGVPTAEPSTVADDPTADAGLSGPPRFPVRRLGVRPVALASPQSTTSVSPYLPSMTLPGFKSRCSTPRLCA